MTRPVIIDTDPGQDDAVAILLALASPELDVRGITCVAGNVPLPLTSLNARKVVDLTGKDVPVYAGCAAPLDRPLVTAEYVHGRTGLDGPALPVPVTPLQDIHAVDFLIDAVKATPGITLCPLGPLTNIATALTRAPGIVRNIKEIVMMGGGYFEQGNITPSAEFNIHVDPTAADIVLRSGAQVTVLPLDCTHQALTTRPRLEALRRLGNRAGVVVAELADFFERYDKEKYGTDGAPLHDPCVIAWLLRPELFVAREVHVTVDTREGLTLGATVVDYWRVTDRGPNVTWVRGINADGFFALLGERLARLP
ncbi:MAG: nucleoside hydrolase [Rhodobacteraceae bacterium]|nr:nucleoside hydrolase [Paracoccaceae bacterium]